MSEIKIPEIWKSDTEASVNSINVAGFIQNSVVDGPGIRAVLFLQGCPHHCKGCHNPETWPYEAKTLQPIDRIAAMIASVNHVNKLTISGGEPLIQVHALNLLLDKLENEYQKKYHIICYTGYKYEDLVHIIEVNKTMKTFLSRINLLIDGPFIEKEKTLDLRYRGSKNQRIIDIRKSLMFNKLFLSDLN